ncbi:MAG: chain length determinant protein EpsF [Aquabacterium sp.]|jgi:succinoglycan biosynthesis transport protein ExoP|nr:MAG: chain length determinant protein EpsF [Aquabacterium sp.]
MSIAQFLAILSARWKWVVGIFASVVIVVMAVSLVWPKRYTATATVVVDVKPDPVAGTMAGIFTPGYMATQSEIFQSDRVAQRVVRNLRMGESVQARLEWEEDTGGTGSIEAWLAERLTGKFSVKPARESNLITVSFKSDTAQDAAYKANAFVQAFLDVNQELRSDPARQYSSFFDTRAKQLREDLERAQTKLSSYQREKGILATDERLDIEVARLNELSSQLVAIQAMSAESASRKTQARLSGDKIQDVLTSPLITSLKAELSRQEALYKQLNAQLGDAHPQLIQLRANIGEVKSRLATETARITGGVGVSNEINQAREADVRASLDAQRAKVLQMKEFRDQVAVLQKDVENAQKAYDSVALRLSQSTLESENKLPNVAVLASATVPTKPSAPILWLNGLLSVVGGLLAAVIWALVSESRDRRIRTVDDLTRYISIPVIGNLGQRATKRLFQTKAEAGVSSRQLLRPLPTPSAAAD